MSAILFNSKIGPVAVTCIIREQHSSALGITELPIETGAKITDHSYVEPKRLELEFADEGAADTWNSLVRFQAKREPFDIVSGLYQYKSMLIKDLTAERDFTTSRILKGSATLQEVVLVKTARTGKKADGNGTPKDKKTGDKTEPTTKRGDQPLAPKRDQSTLHKGWEILKVGPGGDPGGTTGGGRGGR